MFRAVNYLKPLLLLNTIFLIEAQHSYYDDGLSTLGQRINAQVQQELAPLQGLGARINVNVQNNLQHLQNDLNTLDDLSTLGQRINAQVQRNLAPLQGLGARINARVQNSVQHMQNDLSTLGERITQNVEEGLKPVRALELNRRMMDGIGGQTIVTHFPSDVKFIVKNSNTYKCKGEISLKSGDCSGVLEPFEITQSSPKTDWCFLRGYSQVNDNVLNLKLDEYKNLCSSVSNNVEYRYYPDKTSDVHVPIPNSNPYVECAKSDNNICVFHRRNPLLITQYSRQNSFVINSYS
ncbi:hypothetical protein GWI33_022098 [Rhynchophorus ferrugineus]|uniref:Uncharacterized protein n=1 Tax=Rhynchophorus ferrugineus TaxID=354439 RepID=A0A834IR91_RHYFE|nr:hypothetical protein GWI33_022098 [Rhynchophorus ferrugineus]